MTSNQPTLSADLGDANQSSTLDQHGAGNLAWRAAGQTSLTSTSLCQQTSVPAAQKTSYGYDARNRLTGTTYGDASPSITTTYTNDGLPNTVASDNSTWTYTYNKRRLLTNESLNLGGSVYGFAHGYDGNAHENNLTYPDGGSVATLPNALGESTKAGIYATSVSRFPNGGISAFSYGNGLTHTTTQTTRGLPDTSIDTNVINDNYDWDADGNVTAITNSLSGGNSSRTMSYDDRDRLTGTYFTGFSAQINFTYDPLDNLRTYVTPFRNYTHVYDANWRLSLIRDQTLATKYSYGYAGDPGSRGNATSRLQTGGTSENFTFDQGNRMRALSGTTSATYT
ncbi:MAG: hypothetical protein ABI451_07365 [Dokdonella sp.]